MTYAKKSLGQNYLIDKNIINKIINLTNIKNKNILEIGPGRGSITDEIINNKPKSLILIEKDNNLFRDLKIKYSNYKNIQLYNSDILKFDIEKILKPDSIIFGNLPYNISSQILVKILRFKKWPPKFKELIFMFQKELGEKILGKYKTKSYGRLSILANYRLSLKKKFLVSQNCFSPKPKVTSMVISFLPKKMTAIKIKKLQNLEKITNIIFSNKRKMVNKSLKKIFTNIEINEITHLNTNHRPSDINPELYYLLTKIYERD